MKILMVLSDNIYPPDIRVEKEATSLILKGHDIHLICRNSGKQKKKENVNGVKVRRINIQLNNPVGYLLFPIMVFFRILSIVKKYKIDILHAHDLPLAIPTIKAAKICGKPVVLDLHENYPEVLVPIMPKIVVALYKKAEKIVCKHAAQIIVVVDEAKERLAGIGVPPSKIKVVSNFADTRKLDNIDKTPKRLRSPAIVYSGGFSPHRGIDTLLEAMSIVIKKRPDTCLYLIGGRKGELRRGKFPALIKKLSLREHVKMTGWVSFEESINYVRGADICTVPYHSTPQTETTVPHKIFQSMYLKKPVLVSDVKPLKRIIEETNCGKVFKAGDHKDLAKELIWMLDNSCSLSKMGENGCKAIVEKYNWEMAGANLVNVYENIRQRSR